MGGELMPLLYRSFPAAGELPYSLMQTLAKGVHAESDPVHRDNRKMGRNAMALGKVKQGRHQLPPGKVARSTEDDEYVWRKLIVGLHVLSTFRPVSVECAFDVDALIAVRPEVVALGLYQVGRKPGTAVAVKVGEHRHEAGSGQTQLDCRADDAAQILLVGDDLDG